MENSDNIFKQFQQKKQNIVELANKALSFDWITNSERNEIVERIENDVLTIGVIGQMKCGKSTFLNAFVFEDDILPAATTPMTAALSVITYGEKEEICAEFYTEDEWEEQRRQAARDVSEVTDELEKSKIQAAQQLLSASSKLNNIKQYFGQKKKDVLSNLEDYVGTDGKFVSITKSVKITIPKDYLKGVEIVDTPGINDPIASREERTREFLAKADIVLLMLYAGRPFDTIDRTLLFEDVKKCGMGKILIGINKYDIPYENGENEDEIISHVKKEIEVASSQYGDDSINNILKDIEPVLFSAEMALLSYLPSATVSKNEIYNNQWKRYDRIFETNSKDRLREKSKIGELIKLVQECIEKEKSDILITKTLNTIKAAGNKILAEQEKVIVECTNAKKILEMDDSDIENKLFDLEHMEKKISRKIEGVKLDYNEKFNSKIFDFKNKFLGDVDLKKGHMDRIVEDWKIGSGSEESIRNELNNDMIGLTRVLRKDYEETRSKLKECLKQVVGDSFEDIEQIVENKIPDFDYTEFIDYAKTKIIFEIDSNVFTDITDLFEKKNFYHNIKQGVDNWLVRGSRREEIANAINEFSKDFYNKVDVYFKPFEEERDRCIQKIEDEVIKEDIIEPLRKMLEDAKDKKGKRDKKISENEEKLKQAEERKKLVKQQLSTLFV